MRICARCGREVANDEYIAGYGLCVDCYLGFRGVFAVKPLLSLTVCPRCGSWNLGGEWFKPLPTEEVLRRTLLDKQHKLVEHYAEIIDAQAIGKPMKVDRNRYRINMKLHVVINKAVVREVETSIEYVVEKKLCPKCFAKAGKIHKALVQVRSDKGYLTEDEVSAVKSLLKDPSILDDLVVIEENKHGLDLKFSSVNVAKKFVEVFVRATGAKLATSFKPTKYEVKRGKWRGIVTFSVRMPSIIRGDVVEYEGKPAVVRDITAKGVKIEFLEEGSTTIVDFKEYWSGALKKLEKPEYIKAYRVVARDKTTLYLLDIETGELGEYPANTRAVSVKEGDVVYIIRLKNREYLLTNYNKSGGYAEEV